MFCCCYFFVPSSFALEKKSILEVTTDQLLVDTQIAPQGATDDHTAVVWWLPQEFWDSTYARDTSSSEKDKAAMMDALEGVSLLGIVQADVSRLGSFKFYSKEDIERNLSVAYVTGDSSQDVSILKEIKPDLQVILGSIKPILEQALGNMGQNLHFFVLKDVDANGNRLIDPYKSGVLEVFLKEVTGNKLSSEIFLPLNSLFVPRKCSNGKDANVTWSFCPWSGGKL